MKIVPSANNRKVAVITGAAKRLGALMAKHLATCGYDIALHCNHSEREAVKVRDAVAAVGADCRIFISDFTDGDDVEQFISDLMSHYHHIDILINSAATFDRVSISDTDASMFDRVMSINLKTPMLLISRLAPIMDGGLVINITDAKTIRPDSRYAAYLLSKNGLSYLTTLAAQEFAPSLRINAIAPAYLLPSENWSDFESFRDKIPLRQHIDPQYLLQTVDYLIGNRLLTGQIIRLDGGYYNRQG